MIDYSERNHSVELMRIIAMFLIVVWHFSGWFVPETATSPLSQKVMSSMAATTLGIYIIHAQPSLNGILWGKVGVIIKDSPSFALLLDVAIVIIVFFSSMVVETFRQKLSK